MKRLFIMLLILGVMALFFAGCVPTVPEISEGMQVEVTSFLQEAYLSQKGGEKIVLYNGEEPKCGPYCPQCPACDSCCEDCPDCPSCDSCCPECQECQECPVCEECNCPSCSCYQIKWGDLFVDFEAYNISANDLVFETVSFIIKFEDGTETEKEIDIGEFLAPGTIKDYSVGIVLTSAKRVVFVEVANFSYY